MELAKNIENLPSSFHFNDAVLRGMLDLAPSGVMFCDLNFTIQYINQRSFDLFSKMRQHLPIPPEKIVGSSIDLFHKNPSMQRKLLSNDKNLPHRALIQFGPEKLDLLMQAVYNEANQYVGAMVTWDIVTEKLLTEEKSARLSSMIENAPINVMSCDLDLRITYLNPKSRETLKRIEKHLPVKVDQMLGANIDVFHKNPDHQRRMLKDDRALPHRAKIKVGDDYLDLLVTAVYDQNKKYSGAMVTWDIITDKLALVQSLDDTSNQLAAAAEELFATASELTNNSQTTANQSTTAAANTEEVSKGVQTVATNTEELVASIKEIARNTSEAANISKETLKRAQDTNQNITQLGASSQEIGNVIKVISSIAQQTNLLALNATIEAARAGDAGKGFAVVANEVKELAKQTAKATEDITNRIFAIQNDTKEAVGAISGISTVIEKLNAISMAIAAAVEEQNATANEVARVVKESNKGVEGIADMVRTVSSAAQRSSAGANQTVEAAKELAKLAENIKALIKNVQV